MKIKKSWLVWSLIVLGALLATAWLVWFLVNTSIDEESPSEQSLANNLPPQIAYRKIAGDFEAPVDIVSTPIADDARIFVVEQKGLIWVVENGQRRPTPFLDITEQVIFKGEQGLLGMTFHPDYMNNGLIYVNFIAKQKKPPRKTVIAEFKVLDSDINVINKDTQRTVLEFDQPYANHNAGDLAFGPDGYLYIPTGDGGSGGDPDNNGQRLDTLLGKILRIDPTGGQPYAVPDDNPFVGRDKSRTEIWSYGWRNPWRISFDRANGEMFVGDVGQSTYEEINREPANSPGLNYGWRCNEGDEKFEPTSCSESSTYVAPYAFYGHQGEGCSGSVTGGFVYRGKEHPKLNGYYVYADYCLGVLYTIDTNQYTAPFMTHIPNIKITTFGEDSQGEIYFADAESGDINKIVSN
jgi:glucose/arabinose dehydrogenase